MRKIIATALFLLSSVAHGADNTVILTPGSGVTMRTQDVGSGVQSPYNILGNTSGTSIYGTAGSSNTAVLSVQGIASGTALPISAASGAFASGALAAGAMVDLLTMRGTKAPGTAAANSLLSGCVYTSAGVTLTDGQQAACQVTSAGAILVSGVGVAIGSTTSGQTGSLIMGATTTAAPSYTTAQTNPISLTTAGDVRTVFSNTTIAVTNAGTFAVQAAATQSGTWTVQPGNTANTTSWLVKTNDGTNTQILDPCQSAAKVYQTISQTTNTQLFAGTSAKKTYVCHIIVVGADAENISLVSGTGSVCATNTAAMIGATTAAAGLNLSANGGFSIGAGIGSVAVSAVNADNVCLFQSGSGRVSGVMSYVAL